MLEAFYRGSIVVACAAVAIAAMYFQYPAAVAFAIILMFAITA